MGIIALVQKYFDPKKVDFGSDMWQMGLTYPGGWMQVRKDLSNEEKIKTVIHELLHHDPRYGGPLVATDSEDVIYLNTRLNKTSPCRPLAKKLPTLIEGALDHLEREEAIEKETQAIYNYQPLLVKYFEHRLGINRHARIQFMLDHTAGQRQLFYSYSYNPRTEELARIL